MERHILSKIPSSDVILCKDSARFTFNCFFTWSIFGFVGSYEEQQAARLVQPVQSSHLQWLIPLSRLLCLFRSFLMIISCCSYFSHRSNNLFKCSYSRCSRLFRLPLPWTKEIPFACISKCVFNFCFSVRPIVCKTASLTF